MAEFPTAPASAAAKPVGAKERGRKVVVVLQQASLESVKTKKVRRRRRSGHDVPQTQDVQLTRSRLRARVLQGYELLNCDDHIGLHKKHGRNPASSRPDITHQLLLGAC